MKISPARRAQRTSPEAASGWRQCSRWSRKEPLSITIVSRGGAESWWLVKARGKHGVFPGHMALEDVMSQVLNE